MKNIVVFVGRLLWFAFVVITPILGVWVASSLAAYFNGPIWAACLVGALLFPLGPLLWELRGMRAFRAKNEARQQADEEPKERWVPSVWDRLTLRTLSLNLVFLTALLAIFPKEGFTALATRGDWMLQEQDSAEAEVAREVLFASANKLEWLHNWARDNPYEREGDDDLPTPDPNEFPDDSAVAGKDESREEDGVAGSGDAPDKPERARQAGEPPAWPMRAELHPVVAKMPASADTSIEAAATYIAEREKDPFLRVKALHDYVVDRIAYDAPALRMANLPPQDPEKVWREKKGVCSGYAWLLEEMGRHTGDEIVYVTGVSRGLNGDASGAGHAWNAAKIEGRWYLIDATWDAGTVNAGTFTKNYRTSYLFTPPEIFGMDHFPDNESWQLRKDALTRGDFVRQPVLEPRFWSSGLELISPTRSQVAVEGDEVEVVLKNPKRAQLLAKIHPKGSRAGGEECRQSGLDDTTITCSVASAGTYQVRMFTCPKTGGRCPFVGQVEVTR